MFHPIRSLIALLVLIGRLVGADRVAAHAAEGRIAQAVQSAAALPSKPSVRVHGFPFVTQAIRGTYDHIDVTANNIFGRTDGGRGSVTTVSFDGVHIPASKALSGDVHEIRVDHVSGHVDVAFADIESASHLPGVTVRAVAGHDDEVSVDEAVSVAGATVNASVIAHVTLSGNTLTLKVVGVTVADGISVPASVLAGLRSHAAFSVRIPGLPAGVKLTAIVVTPDGVVAALQATGLTLTR
jgi:hypothetical protein